MADNDKAQEATEEPTQKRLTDARKKGDVVRSKELNTAATMIAATVGLLAFGSSGAEAFKQFTISQLSQDRDRVLSEVEVLNSFGDALIGALHMILPFLGLMFLVSLCTPMVLGGWVWSVSSLKVDFKKLDPFKGLRRVFGMQGVIELLKALLKVILMGVVSILLFKSQLLDYLSLGLAETNHGLEQTFYLLFTLLLALVVVLIVLAAIDAPIEWIRHKNKLRMTMQEIKEENKETNGNSELKQKIRSIQQSIANKSMLLDVPKANVIIVNPTHYSVALEYTEGSDAPKVVAKGVDHMALKIREIGVASKVEIFSAPQLARAIYRNTKVGDNIPSELYVAVAQVLAYVFQLQNSTQTEARSLKAPNNLFVPKSMRDSE
ncbi:MAG: flagellar biosynthesis protein FlhB [Gammaproteobacteria bacterium]|nr:flagellar biosynthesis protein FlhB [Gammaproteobacteria bacterium]